MKKTFAIFSIFLTLMLAGTLLAGCGGEKDESAPPPASPAPESPDEPAPPDDTTPTTPASPPDSADWITVSSESMSIDIPPAWAYAIADDSDNWGVPGDILISSEDGSLIIYVGYMIAGNPDDYIAENPSEPFAFDSGTVGYALESPEGIMWLNPDLFLGLGVSFQHGGDRASFTDNEELILRIARSYRSS